MKFIHIGGAPRSGKSTVVLNLRLAYKILFSKNYLDKINDILFLGRGLPPEHEDWSRLTGTDTISTDDEVLNLFFKGLISSSEKDLIVVCDTYLPILNNQALEDHERVVRFCLVDEESLLSRGVEERNISWYMKKQEKLLNDYSRDGIDFKIWKEEDLQTRVEESMKLIGEKRLLGGVIEDFEAYWRDEDNPT